jgi:hypothetical protein
MRFRTAILALAAVALLTPETLSAREIKVGVILPYSGVSALFGEQIDRGIMLYHNEHKAELATTRSRSSSATPRGPTPTLRRCWSRN